MCCGCSFTFVSTADDSSHVRYNPLPGNGSRCDECWEDLIDSSFHIPFGDFGLGNNDHRAWGHDDNPYHLYWRQRHRRSHKVEIVAGDKHLLQAQYSSGDGGDHLQLGVIAHSTSLNRKDAGAAIDEKQIVSLDLQRHLQLVNITITGAHVDGTFTLSTGGKTSRPISARASEHQVRNVVRELLSNCETSEGNPEIGGGTFDCWQGRGLDYRGLAATHSNGAHSTPEEPIAALPDVRSCC